MQRDNQGRELLRLPTTMRYAFTEAWVRANGRAMLAALYGDEDPNLEAINMVGSALTHGKVGHRKAPAWTVTRRVKK